MKKSAVLLILAVVVLVALNGFFIMAVNFDDNLSTDNKRVSMGEVRTTSLILEDYENEAEDTPVQGTALERASSVALAYIGEGMVTDSEIGDEEGYYEIEITLDNGSQVDVHLSEDFDVLSTEYEDDED